MNYRILLLNLLSFLIFANTIINLSWRYGILDLEMKKFSIITFPDFKY